MCPESCFTFIRFTVWNTLNMSGDRVYPTVKLPDTFQVLASKLQC